MKSRASHKPNRLMHFTSLGSKHIGEILMFLHVCLVNNVQVTFLYDIQKKFIIKITDMNRNNKISPIYSDTHQKY